jgi:F-type H+-transporting ATPase subunit epsilon
MADKLQFELVSPERLLLSEPVGMVVVPGTEGNFGVLPGHALFISTVRPGVIDVYAEGMPTITQRIFVSGGFAEVTPERCTVLADEAVPFSALDRAAIEAALRDAQSEAGALRDQLARLQGEERDRAALELAHCERRLAVAQAKLDALGLGAGAH